MPLYFLLMAAAAAVALKARDSKSGSKQRREEFRGDSGTTWAVYTDPNTNKTGFEEFILHVFVVEGGSSEEPVLVYSISTNGKTKLISSSPEASQIIITMALNDLRISPRD
jgi:hypothetical protein